MKVEQTLGKKLRAIKIHAIKIQSRRVEIIALACNFPGNFSCATRKFLTKLHSLKAPLGYVPKNYKKKNSGSNGFMKQLSNKKWHRSAKEEMSPLFYFKFHFTFCIRSCIFSEILLYFTRTILNLTIIIRKRI